MRLKCLDLTRYGKFTDHRIEFTAHNLPAVMNGDLQDIIDALQLADRTEKLKESASA